MAATVNCPVDLPAGTGEYLAAAQAALRLAKRFKSARPLNQDNRPCYSKSLHPLLPNDMAARSIDQLAAIQMPKPSRGLELVWGQCQPADLSAGGAIGYRLEVLCDLPGA